jgi:hypothetical protein
MEGKEMTVLDNVGLSLTERLGPNPLKTLVYLLIPIFLLLLVFPLAIQPGQVTISEYHDTISCMLPNTFLMQNPFALWNNMWLTGYPEISSVDTDRFYPFTFPITVFTQDIFVINLLILIHLYIAFLAFNKLGSLLVKDQDWLFLFSLGYMFFGGIMARTYIGHYFQIYALAWTPLIFYFALKIMVFKEETAHNIIGLALCESLVFMAGATSYYVFYINAILLVFFLYYLSQEELQKSTVIALVVSALLFLLISSAKLLPNIAGIPYTDRIDFIDPLGDGGSLFNNFGSLIFGIPIDSVFGWYESAVLIGIIPVLFAIIAIIWGRRDIVVPSFYAIVFSLIWADGGRILLSFIHLLPILNNFRCAGRILGVIAPIILLLALYGLFIVKQRLQDGESFTLDPRQKRNVKFGVAILAIIAVLELPWFFIPSLEAALAAVLVFGFILMIYVGRANSRSLLLFFSLAFLTNIAVLARNPDFYGNAVLARAAVVVIVIGAALAFNREMFSIPQIKTNPARIWELLALFSILLLICGTTYVFKGSDPGLSKSPAIGLIEKLKDYPADNQQIWVFETGWPVLHIDFTYNFIMNGFHPMRALYSFVPKNVPPLAVNIGETEYYLADYLVDTGYLENGNQNLPNFTFKVDNISVYKPDHVLPNAFVVRDNQLITSRIEKFTPDEITLSGQFRKGDVAVLKAAFYPGWKVNNKDAVKTINMPGSLIQGDTSTITFRYDPFEAKAGIILTVIGILSCVTVYIKRREIERFLKSVEEKPEAKKPQKGRKFPR